MSKEINPLDVYMQPLQELSGCGEQTVAKLVELQKYCFKDVVNASFEQMRSLSTCADPQQAMTLQFYFCKGLEAHVNFLSEQTHATLSEAQVASMKTIDCASEKMAMDLDRWIGASWAHSAAK